MTKYPETSFVVASFVSRTSCNLATYRVQFRQFVKWPWNVIYLFLVAMFHHLNIPTSCFLRCHMVAGFCRYQEGPGEDLWWYAVWWVLECDILWRKKHGRRLLSTRKQNVELCWTIARSSIYSSKMGATVFVQFDNSATRIHMQLSFCKSAQTVHMQLS